MAAVERGVGMGAAVVSTGVAPVGIFPLVVGVVGVVKGLCARSRTGTRVVIVVIGD